MVLSQREKYIAIGVGAAVALLVINWVVISPLTSWSTSIKDKRQANMKLQDEDSRLHKKLKALNVIWQDMQKSGLKSDVSDAQGQLSNAVREWSEQSGVSLTDTHFESSSTDSKTGFVRVPYQVSCAGTTSGIAKLLYQIESAKIPIRIDTVRVNSTKDGVDDLKAELNLSTLCVPAIPSKSAAPVVSTGS